MVVGMKLSATPMATSRSPGRTATRYPSSRRCVREPQVTGGEDHQADDQGAPRAEGAQHPRQQGERDGEAGEGGGDHGQPGLLGGHGEGLLEVEGDQDERGGSGGATEDGEGDAGAQGSGPEELEGHERVGGAAFDGRRRPRAGRRRRRGWPGRAGRSMPRLGDAQGAVDQGDDCAGDGRGAAPVEPAAGAARALREHVPGEDDGGDRDGHGDEEDRGPAEGAGEQAAEPRRRWLRRALRRRPRCSWRGLAAGPGKVSRSSDIAAGLSAAAPAPWTMRPATSSRRVGGGRGEQGAER